MDRSKFYSCFFQPIVSHWQCPIEWEWLSIFTSESILHFLLSSFKSIFCRQRPASLNHRNVSINTKKVPSSRSMNSHRSDLFASQFWEYATKLHDRSRLGINCCLIFTNRFNHPILAIFTIRCRILALRWRNVTCFRMWSSTVWYWWRRSWVMCARARIITTAIRNRMTMIYRCGSMNSKWRYSVGYRRRSTQSIMGVFRCIFGIRISVTICRSYRPRWAAWTSPGNPDRRSITTTSIA